MDLMEGDSFMTTISDIAKYLGISISTVSKGLNNASDISEETRQLVLDAAVALGYMPKRRMNLSNNNDGRKVCVLIENMDYENHEEFSYDLIQGFKQTAFLKNWLVDIVPMKLTAQSTNQYDQLLLANRYSGGFIIGSSMHNDYSKQIAKTRFPTVLYDNNVHTNPKVGYVGTDCYEGLRLAIEHLYELGHRKIAFLNGAKNTTVSYERTQAFETVMKEFGLKIYPVLFEYGYYVPDCAKYHVPKFIDNGATAIICASDLIASGAIAEVTKRGLRVPEDISIIGFDDLPFCTNLNPPLTTIRQDRQNLGRSAMFLLDCLINNIPINKVLLHAQFILRESTCQCKNTANRTFK
jgi:LacI family transcriptional regulator